MTITLDKKEIRNAFIAEKWRNMSTLHSMTAPAARPVIAKKKPFDDVREINDRVISLAPAVAVRTGCQ